MRIEGMLGRVILACGALFFGGIMGASSEEFLVSSVVHPVLEGLGAPKIPKGIAE